MNRKKTIFPKGKASHSHQRRKAATENGRRRLVFSILRSFLAGVGVTTAGLCLLATVFSATALPLAWIGPTACGAASLGAFASGAVLSRSLPRGKLLAGLACGVFYCVCAIIASLLMLRVPVWGGSNLSLMLCLLFGALAGGAAGALRSSSSVGVR